ncbi:MAG: pyrroline-5-carboxylate reductase [Epsilonproteobacteria bacterium]|nr:pyrroline-5-carboxylate reductase [Campylobacterota bacterium]
MKLTIIGTGKMAEAIIEGIYRDIDVTVVGRDEGKLKYFQDKFNVKTKPLSYSVDISNENVLLAIKPFALRDVARKLKGEALMLLSILAGVTIESLRENIKSQYYIRAMPNLAAAYQKSMTTLTGDETCKKEAVFICEKFGKALWLSSEKELDIATAIAGSGPAFLALVAESMSDGGVNEGLKRKDSEILVQGLFEGFYELLSHKHPAIIKDEVMSPGGTTAAGVEALEKNKVRFSFISAIKRAYKRAKK